MSNMDMVEIMKAAFAKECGRYDYTVGASSEEMYYTFVHKFAKENNFILHGELVDYGDYGSAWNTLGFEFNSEEDLIMFKIRHG